MMTVEEIVEYLEGKIRAYHRFIIKAMDEGRPWQEVNAGKAELLDLLRHIRGENEDES